MQNKLLPQEKEYLFLLKLNNNWRTFYHDNRLKLLFKYDLTENDQKFLENFHFNKIELEQVIDGPAREPIIYGFYSLYLEFEGDIHPLAACDSAYNEEGLWKHYGFVTYDFKNEEVFLESENKLQEDFLVDFTDAILSRIFFDFNLLEKVDRLYQEQVNLYQAEKNKQLSTLFKETPIQHVEIIKNGCLNFTFENKEKVSFVLDSNFHITL